MLEVWCRSVFWALIGAIYLTLGMPEVYRVLFEVFGFDVDAKSCQPKSRNIEDVDYLSPELDGRRLTWQEIAYYQVVTLFDLEQPLICVYFSADNFNMMYSHY